MGRRSDRIRRRMPFVWTGYTLSNIAKPLVALAPAWGWVMGARVRRPHRQGDPHRSPRRAAARLQRPVPDRLRVRIPPLHGLAGRRDRAADRPRPARGRAVVPPGDRRGDRARHPEHVRAAPDPRHPGPAARAGRAAGSPQAVRHGPAVLDVHDRLDRLLPGQLGRRVPAAARQGPGPERDGGGAVLRALQHALLGPVVAARPPLRPRRQAPRAGGRAAGLRGRLRRLRAGRLRRRRVAVDGDLRGLHRRHRRRQQGAGVGPVAGRAAGHRAGRVQAGHRRGGGGGQPGGRRALADRRAGRRVRAGRRCRAAGAAHAGRDAAGAGLAS